MALVTGSRQDENWILTGSPRWLGGIWLPVKTQERKWGWEPSALILQLCKTTTQLNVFNLHDHKECITPQRKTYSSKKLIFYTFVKQEEACINIFIKSPPEKSSIFYYMSPQIHKSIYKLKSLDPHFYNTFNKIAEWWSQFRLPSGQAA